MTRTVAAAIALLCLTGTAFAGGDVCDKPVGKLTANQYLDCNAQHNAEVKAQASEVRAEREDVPGEAREETERKLRLRQPVAGEIPIVSPYREIPIK